MQTCQDVCNETEKITVSLNIFHLVNLGQSCCRHATIKKEKKVESIPVVSYVQINMGGQVTDV